MRACSRWSSDYETGELPQLIRALTPKVGKVDNRRTTGRDLRSELAVSDEGEEAVKPGSIVRGRNSGFSAGPYPMRSMRQMLTAVKPQTDLTAVGTTVGFAGVSERLGGAACE